jgi:predicted lipid-binding transport protein (Tim44 family)
MDEVEKETKTRWKWPNEPQARLPSDLPGILLRLIGGLLAGLLVGALNKFLEHSSTARAFVDFIGAHIGVVGLQLALGLATFVLGTALYLFRCRRASWYGTLEIVVGVGAAAYVANQILGQASGSGGTIFAEAAALYVIVRGYDNIYKSLKGEKRRLWWNRFFFGQESAEKLA